MLIDMQNLRQVYVRGIISLILCLTVVALFSRAGVIISAMYSMAFCVLVLKSHRKKGIVPVLLYWTILILGVYFGGMWIAERV